MHLHVISRETAKQHSIPRFFTGKPCVRGNIAERRTSTAACLCQACKDFYRDQRLATESADPSRKEAKAERGRKYRQANGDKIKQRKRLYYEKNREAIIAKSLEYVRQNREQVSSRMKAYCEARAPEINARKRERYIENRDEVTAMSRAYYAENRDEVMKRQRAFYRENKSLFRAHNAKRRAAKAQRTPAWFSEFDEFVVQEAFALATERRSATGLKWHVDHMVPLLCRKASGLHCGWNIQVIPKYLNQSKHNRLWLHEPDQWLSAMRRDCKLPHKSTGAPPCPPKMISQAA